MAVSPRLTVSPKNEVRDEVEEERGDETEVREEEEPSLCSEEAIMSASDDDEVVSPELQFPFSPVNAAEENGGDDGKEEEDSVLLVCVSEESDVDQDVAVSPSPNVKDEAMEGFDDPDDANYWYAEFDEDQSPFKATKAQNTGENAQDVVELDIDIGALSKEQAADKVKNTTQDEMERGFYQFMVAMLPVPIADSWFLPGEVDATNVFNTELEETNSEERKDFRKTMTLRELELKEDSRCEVVPQLKREEEEVF